MAKTDLSCKGCGHRSFQWMGKCPTCGAWDSFMPTVVSPQPRAAVEPQAIGTVDVTPHRRVSTGITELDRVLGGGLVKGSVVLLAGEPGVGKSTLMLQAAAGFEKVGQKVLICCGEESLDQVAARAMRLGGPKKAGLSAATDLGEIAGLITGVDIALIDSVQTLSDDAVAGQAGSVSQVRHCAASLAATAKAAGTALILIGHVTKDGSVAGPRTLEHLVDVVLTFEGERDHELRATRATKNRFGPTGELGVFEMGNEGLTQITDASKLLLSERNPGTPGSAVGCILDGRRPLAVEIQALVGTAATSSGRRVTHGLEISRLCVTLAILDKRAQVKLGNLDVYASVAGGLKATEPGVDLALALAIVSTAFDIPVPGGMAAVGELGLGGEVRSVSAMQARIDELLRLGFEFVVAPPSTGKLNKQKVKCVTHLGQALQLLQPRSLCGAKA